MLFGLRTRGIVVQHDFRRFIWVFLGVFPALHRGPHKAHHLVLERRIGKVLFQRVKPVFQCGNALLFVFEHVQIIRRQTCVDHLPVFIIGHGRHAGGLILQQRIHVKALFQHGHTILTAFGGQLKLAHPAEKGEFIAKEPDAQRLAFEVIRGLDPGILAASQHHARGFERLRDVHHRQTLLARGQSGGHPFNGDIGTTTGQHLCRRNVWTARLDRDV